MAKWRDPRREKPPLHKSVIVLLRNAVGTTFDVACYVGLQPDGEDRWILADVRLETKQIAWWQNPQRPPE